MPGATDCWLDDNLAQRIINAAPLCGRKVLDLTCRRLCQMVRDTGTFNLRFNLCLEECEAEPQDLLDLPAARTYQRVHQFDFDGYAYDEDEWLPSWSRLCSFVWAAVQRWPGVERIIISPGWMYDDEAENDVKLPVLAGYLMGAVVPLQQAKALRFLDLMGLADSYSLCYLPLLTQLTELRLSTHDLVNVELVVGERAPLAGMKHLRALRLGGRFHLCLDSSMDQADLPLVLPPQLTKLEVKVPRCEPGEFWFHIAACSRLVSLTVWCYANAAADHPSWMLCRIADSLKCLKHLALHCHITNEQTVVPEVLGMLAGTQAGFQQEEEQGWEWEDLAAPGIAAIPDYSRVVVPPPNMGALTALQTIELAAPKSLWCCGPYHWHALAGCRALRQLHGLEAGGAPPAGVKFPGVTDLQIRVSTPPGDVVAVLRAFPALHKLQLELQLDTSAMQQARADNEQQQQQQQPAGPDQAGQPAHQQAQQDAPLLLGSLTQANIHLTRGALSTDSCALWRGLWRAMPALQRLTLEWPHEVDLLQQLPPLAAFAGLTSLALCSKRYEPGGQNWQRVGLQPLLALLQGLGRLERLKLQLAVCSQEGAAAAGSDSGFVSDSSAHGSGMGVGDAGDSGRDHDNCHAVGDSSGCMGRNDLLACLQRTLPSLKRLLPKPLPEDLPPGWYLLPCDSES